MRKLKLVAALAIALMVSGASFAQKGSFYIGTTGLNLGITANPGVGNVVRVPFMTGFMIGDGASQFGVSPELGYFLSDRIAVGLSLGFNYASNDVTVGTNTTTVNNTTFGANPYLRYYVRHGERLSLYFQAGFTYQSTSSSVDGVDEVNYMDFTIRPGIAYKVCERFTINATYGALGYYDFDGSSVFGLNIDGSTLNFGLTYSF